MLVEWLFDWAGPFHIGGASVVLPFAQQDFGVSRVTMVWLMVGFSMATAAFILPAAYLGNSLGRRKMVILGVTLDMVSQFSIFWVPSFALLIPVRMLGGIGNALTLANLPPLVVESWPQNQRGRTLGIMGIGMGIGILLTTPIAGVFADTLGWRYLYLFTSVLYSLLLLCAIFVVKESTHLSKERVSLRRFDYPGVVLVTTFLASLSISMQKVGNSATQILALGLLVLAIFAFVTFVRLELRSPFPLIDPRIFKNKGLSRAVLRSITISLVNSSDRFLIPFFLIQGLGWSGSKTGLVMMAQSAAQPVFAPIAGVMVDRLGTTKPVVLSHVLVVIGGVMLITLGSNPNPFHVAAALFVMGSGWGLFTTPNRHDIYSSVPQEKLSLAQAVGGMTGHGTTTVGAVMGASIFGIFAGMTIPRAFSASLVIMISGFAIATILIWVLLRTRKPVAVPSPVGAADAHE